MADDKKYGPSPLERVVLTVAAYDTEQAYRQSIFRQFGRTPPVRWPLILTPAEAREWIDDAREGER